MIKSVFPDVVVRPLYDQTYNDTAWIVHVKDTVTKAILGTKWTALGTSDLKIGLIGLEKDHSSFYLKLFPEWGHEAVLPESTIINATDLRSMLYSGKYREHEISPALSPPIAKFIFQEFMKTEQFNHFKNESLFLENYTKKWGQGPFLTGDALVQVGGNILLITRGEEYGTGLLAMPGGFLKPNERFLDGAIRELKEETVLKVPVPVLKGSIVGRMLCDDPHRSLRGRIISEAFHFKLENERSLPEVRGTDDANEANWYSFNDLKEDQFFEDHYFVIKKFDHKKNTD
jgi:bifunctional NMN adenylyltransferase/nudix hydrolase